MKIKIIAVLVTIVGILGLTGCAPKETTLSGQMFIVTQGADNVKLGDVAILLIEKSQVTDFLQKKQSTIDSEIESQQEELTKAEEQVTAAFKNGENAKKNYISFTENSPYEKDPDYIKVKSHLATVSRLEDSFQQQYDSLDAKVTSATSDGSSDMDTFNALLTQRNSAQQSLDIEKNMVISLQAKLYDIQIRAEEEANQMLEAAQAGVTNAESDAATAKAALEKMPTPEDYFGDFLPVVFQKTISDSDGKYSFVYPPDKSFALFALRTTA